MRRVLLVVAAVAAIAACKGSRSGSGSGSVIAIDWAKCEAALIHPYGPASWRAKDIIAACPVCGDWKPILEWSVPAEKGGPTRAAIEDAMARCNAYCDANGKQRFLNNLDDARGTENRKPWRLLGEICKDKIGAVPDARYASAPLFALDRIARAAGARDPKLVADVVLPLPAVTVTGVGVDLPDGDQKYQQALDVAITVLPNELYLGHLPHVRLTPHGLDVDLGKPDAYPGTRVTDLHAQLSAMLGQDQQLVVILASKATPATAVADAVIAAGDTQAAFGLGVTADSAPRGWQLPAMLLPRLLAKATPSGSHVGNEPEPATVEVSPGMTVEQLAAGLSKLHGDAVLVRTQ